MAQSDPDYDAGSRFQEALKFDTAIVCYQKILARLPADHKAVKTVEKRITECRYGREFVSSPRNFVVVNAGPNINSPQADYAPVLSENEDLMVFTSRRSFQNVNSQTDPAGKYYEDIYYSRRTEGHWSPALNIGPTINTRFHDSDLALSADGKQLLLYSEQQQGDIMISYLVNGKWTTPVALPYPVNSPSRESSAAFSADGKQLFLASDRPGGAGGLDIYVFTRLEKGEWSLAMNLGPSINTSWDEDSPFPDYDGKTLYFSSTGHTSMGGFDIFQTRFDGHDYAVPENLGYPINTPGDDLYFVSTRDGKRAYYSSLRQGGVGEEDIYEMTLPPELARPTSVHLSQKDTLGVTTASDHLVINFATGSATLDHSEHQRLKNWLTGLVIRKGMVVRIEGHADAVGEKESNLELSRARAVSVQELLKSARLDAVLEIAVWGEERPVASNDEARGRALNRRVEITVIQN